MDIYKRKISVDNDRYDILYLCPIVMTWKSYAIRCKAKAYLSNIISS